MKQLGLAIDLDRCIGCKTCVVACRNYHELVDPATAVPGEMPYYLRVETERTGTYPAIAVRTWVVPCQHCRKPPCLKACAEGAITKDAQTGIVRIHRDKCTGCGDCITACPYAVIQFDKAAAKAHKCDLCYERVTAGDAPVCAETCMTDAISFGELALLRQDALDAERQIVRKLSRQSVIYVQD